MRYNPPPNWPAPPPGWTPKEGWSPDPSWPPAPDGWQFWIDESRLADAPTATFAHRGSTTDPNNPAFKSRVSSHPESRGCRSTIGLLIAAALVVVVATGAIAWHFAARSGTKSDLLGTVAAFGPDGDLATIEGLENTVRIHFWNITTRQENLPPITSEGIARFALSPDGQTAAGLCSCGGNWGTVFLWNTRTGQQICTIRESRPGELGDDLAFAPRGTTLATGGSGGAVSMWDTGTCQKQRQFRWTTVLNNVVAIAYSPDGSLLASANSAYIDRSIVLWDTSTGAQVLAFPSNHSNNVAELAFTQDGSTLVSRDYDGNMKMWNPRSGQQSGQTVSGVSGFALSPDGNAVATAKYHHQGDGVTTWDISTGQPTGQPFSSDCGCGSPIAYSPDGSTLAASLQRGEDLKGGNGTLLSSIKDGRRK